MVAALRFFSTITLGRPDLSRKLIRIHCRRKLPTVLSIEEVGRLLSATSASSIVRLSRWPMALACGSPRLPRSRVGDIDSKRMLIRVERGKSLPLRRPGAGFPEGHTMARKKSRREIASGWQTTQGV
jgi:integrase/recombinase XerD